MKAQKIIKKAQLSLDLPSGEGKRTKVVCDEASMYITVDSILAETPSRLLELEYNRIDDIKVYDDFGDNCKMEVYFDDSVFNLIAKKEYADYFHAIRHLLLPGIRSRKK